MPVLSHSFLAKRIFFYYFDNAGGFGYLSCFSTNQLNLSKAVYCI